MPDYEDIDGWTILRAGTEAHRRSRGGLSSTVLVDDRDVEVDIDEGQGFYAARLRCCIPIPVIIRLLENVGYRVTREDGRTCGALIGPEGESRGVDRDECTEHRT